MPCAGVIREGKIVLVALLFAAGVSFGDEPPTPVDRQAAILLKALAYDRNLETRSGERVSIAVLYQEGEGTALEAAELAEAFKIAGKDGIKGLPVTAQALAFTSIEALLKQIDTYTLNVFYIHTSLTTALSSVEQVTRSRRIISLGATRRMVEQGLALGIYSSHGVPRLALNARAGMVEGLDLDPAIILVATVIE
ncbi:MAG: DUF4154 domain-containing protein [Candidatus Latescibacteria bacterium]|nr:DUF4154 domain-containing protein [Candidatus Latescibacterota bacterium]